MSVTGRDRIWSIALRVGIAREQRGYLREITPDAIATAAEQAGVDTSTRTVRRVLDAMSETGILEALPGRNKQYRLQSWMPSTDVSDGGTSHPLTYLAADPDQDVGPATDVSLDDLPEPIDYDRLIYHLYADWGIESEPLSAYGTVVRVGIDPQRTAIGDVIRADARDPPLQQTADLVVCHPDCRPYSPASRLTGDPDEYPRQIPRARETARAVADAYIIENVPQAIGAEDGLREPRHGSLVRLNGRMFGLPVPYERAFECSFEVPQPPEQADLVDREGPFAVEPGRLGVFRGEEIYWRAVKQVTGDYPAKKLKTSGIPAPYIHYLAYWWLRARDTPVEPQGVRV